MSNKIKLGFASFSLGLSSMIGQIILIRELMIVFYGNELSIGIVLASWLLWTGTGSLLLGIFVDKVPFKKRLLSYLQLTYAIILPLNIFLIRSLKHILSIQLGELIGFMPMIGSSFLSLSVICMLSGGMFTLLSKIAAEDSKLPAQEVGRIYLLEGLGASIGGLSYSFFMIQHFSSLQNTLIAGTFNVISSMLFSRNIVHLAYLIIIATTYILPWTASVDRYLRTLQFRPLELVESIDSKYGSIAITKLNKNYSFYENGLLMFTANDLLSSEESVHYAMLEHPLPKKVLLIGGGMSGSLLEILKHHVDSIDYVELDPMLISLATKYTPPIEDTRINFKYMDGRLLVKKLYFSTRSKNISDTVRAKPEGLRREPSLYDVIILNLPDPYTALLNRFYSVEFFREIKKILSDKGIFSFTLTSSENYINPEHAVYLNCIYNSLKQEFSDVKMLPGDNVIFLASPKDNILTYDADILIQRLKERNIRTKFVREYYMPSKLHPLRIAYIESVIKKSGPGIINQDFKPIGYFYHMLVWFSLFQPSKTFLSYFESVNIYMFIALIIFVFIILFLIQKLMRLSFKIPVILSVGSTGMSEICFQIVVILAFQSLYGYMYYRIGLILASFMIGLVMGGLFINRMLEKIEDQWLLYIKTQFYISLYPLLLALLCIGLAKINDIRPDIGNNLQLIFAFLPIVAGFLGGFQFPLATKICLVDQNRAGKIAGFLYGIDLFGSCIGGLVAGILLIPILGIIQTCVLLCIINFSVLLLLASNR